jgi:uncharacterized protein (TIGR03790 family)
MRFKLIAIILGALATLSQAAASGVSNLTLALIVNDNDPQSAAVASYYQVARKIPAENVIHTRFNHRKSVLDETAFLALQQQVQRQVPGRVQAYALTWTKPYKVECMSITSAFALGFDRAYCAEGCRPTRRVPYFNSPSRQPYSDFGLRPTMMLAGKNEAQVRRLIDRGVAADASRPDGRAYLVSTSDRNRNVRAASYPSIAATMNGVLDIELVEADYIENRTDILFYFTGVKTVEKLATNHFLPGAIADHLTSSGGALFGHRQMSALNWLEAGASGSYGTVVEPCNFPGKFPDPAIVMQHYLGGETLIEAYWKSVAMPGQGIFVGEPLSAPYEGCRLVKSPAGVFEFDLAPAASHAPRATAHCR